jgi:hypothetical protein
VAWKADATGANSRAACHFAIDEREGDRDAELAIEYVRQQAVPRVVVVLVVAPEPESVIKVSGDRVGLSVGLERRESPRQQRGGHLVEPRQDACDVQAGVDVARDEGRASRHVETFIVQRGQLFKPGGQARGNRLDARSAQWEERRHRAHGNAPFRPAPQASLDAPGTLT